MVVLEKFASDMFAFNSAGLTCWPLMFVEFGFGFEPGLIEYPTP
jgi:hypothetical protein